MSIPVVCSCGKSMRAPAEWAGRDAKCPGCGQPVHIPGHGAAAATCRRNRRQEWTSQSSPSWERWGRRTLSATCSPNASALGRTGDSLGIRSRSVRITGKTDKDCRKQRGERNSRFLFVGDGDRQYPFGGLVPCDHDPGRDKLCGAIPCCFLPSLWPLPPPELKERAQFRPHGPSPRHRAFAIALQPPAGERGQNNSRSLLLHDLGACWSGHLASSATAM